MLGKRGENLYGSCSGGLLACHPALPDIDIAKIYTISIVQALLAIAVIIPHKQPPGSGGRWP